ncbi:hypothetical protein CBA19CS22_13505 [Caballeronia novacaledonica]|uniref:Uncharacterized protein n=1 Tax=Caballeronia novacaledonica TaxID=1544861 RepID=A0ACB5QSG7_9BURK|nr:hypothetical protein CBA19CS22_13505 [Caballeronia novacaledonica]
MERGELEEAAKDPDLAHAYTAETMMAFAVEFERLVEFALMLLIGSLVSAHWRPLVDWRVIWPVLFLLLVARPLATTISLVGSSLNAQQRWPVGWLGTRASAPSITSFSASSGQAKISSNRSRPSCEYRAVGSPAWRERRDAAQTVLQSQVSGLASARELLT